MSPNSNGAYQTFLPYFVGGRKANPSDDYAALQCSYYIYCIIHVLCWVGALTCDIALYAKFNHWSEIRSLVHDLSLSVLISTILAFGFLLCAMIYYWAYTRDKDRTYPALWVSLFTSAVAVSLFFSGALLVHFAVHAPAPSAFSLNADAPPPPPPAAPLTATVHANVMQPFTDFLILGVAFKVAVLTFLKINSAKAYGDDVEYTSKVAGPTV